MAFISETQFPPWYRLEIGPRLKPRTRKLFEAYSGIAPDEIESHLYELRDRAWSVQQYPCIGQWTFLLTRTPDLPCYEDILTRLKAGASILDLGCCFGQDLRYMAADGAPTDNMWSSDIVPDLWNISYDMYRDTGSMKARFLQADILDSASSLTELNGKVDIVLVNQVFHLFDWDRQVEAGKNIVALSRPGTWVVGYQIGSAIGRAVPVTTMTGGTAGTGGSTSRFHHSPDTWREIWQQIEKLTSTEWVVESSVHELRKWGLEDEDLSWMRHAELGFEFIARMIHRPGSRN